MSKNGPRLPAWGCEERTMWSGGGRLMGAPRSGQPRDARLGHRRALRRCEVREEGVDVLAAAGARRAFLQRRESLGALGEEAVHADAIARPGRDRLAAQAHVAHALAARRAGPPRVREPRGGLQEVGLAARAVLQLEKRLQLLAPEVHPDEAVAEGKHREGVAEGHGARRRRALEVAAGAAGVP